MNANHYIEIANKLTDSQLQQLCRQGIAMGFLKEEFNLNQERSALVMAAASIYMSLDLAKDN